MSALSSCNSHSCPHCLRKYKLSMNLNKHVGICQFLQQSRKQQDNEVDNNEKIPSMRELFNIVQYLSVKIDKLEKENSQLKQHQKKQLNILQWLNEQRENKPDIIFSDWINMYLLPEIKHCMDLLYEHDIYQSVSALFERVITNHKIEHSLCSFDKKKLLFYVYIKTDTGALEWVQLSDNDFIKLIKQIQARYIIEFMKGWYADNESFILENESYYETYIRYYEKITKEENFVKYKNVIYSAIKTNIKNVIEYEF